MDEQQALGRLKLGNKILVVWPVGIATICLGLVVPGLVSPLWGVLLGFVMLVLLTAAWIVAGRLRASSAAEAAAIAAVPRPARCDRCHETDPVTCPRPWLGICPLRSIETNQTYKDFLRT
jgi:hypothetical protein